MPTFTATATDILDSTPDELFATATSFQLLSRWITDIDNVRSVPSNVSVGVGSRFLADEALAEKSTERDCVYEITAWEPGRAFAFRSVGEALFAGELRLKALREGVQATWTFAAGPTALFDKIASLAMKPMIRKQMNRQAERELKRLNALAKK